MAAAGVLAGCGGSDAVKPSPLPQFTPTAEARIAWRNSLGDSKRYVFAPALRAGGIYAAANDGSVARFDAANGKRAWRATADARLSGGVGADADQVLVASEKGVVLAYSLDGKPLWRSTVTSEVLSAPHSAGGLVVVRSGDGRIAALDAATGDRRWDYQATLPPLLLRADAGVAIVRNIVLAGLPGGKLVALNLETGAPMWDAVVAQPKGANELERITDVAAAPVVEDDHACAVAFQGRIACYELTKGALLWSRDASSAVGLAADPLAVFMVDENSVVTAFDKASGATLWKQDKLSARRLSAPAVVGSLVVVGDFEGYVHMLERDSGAFVARIATDGSAISARPLRVGGNVLVQTRRGGLYAISVK
jgi:outer membrane protein assembly factor BamB